MCLFRALYARSADNSRKGTLLVSTSAFVLRANSVPRCSNGWCATDERTDTRSNRVNVAYTMIMRLTHVETERLSRGP